MILRVSLAAVAQQDDGRHCTIALGKARRKSGSTAGMKQLSASSGTGNGLADTKKAPQPDGRSALFFLADGDQAFAVTR
jgi:hypothetical protein